MASAAPTHSRRRVWLTLAALALLLATGASLWLLPSRLRAASEWKEAEAALAKDDFQAARQALLHCRECRPSDAEIWLALGKLERRDGNLGKALELLQEARRLGSSADRVDVELLLAETQNGAVARVEPRLRSAITAHHGDASPMFEALVKGWLAVQAVERAHIACDEWASSFPSEWRAHYWLGWILETEGYTALAAAQYRLAVDACPENLGARFRLAATLLDLCEFPRALAQLESCQKARPTDPAVRFALARCLQGLGRNEEAEAALQSLIQENKMLAPAYLLLARSHLSRDDSAIAVDYARRAIDLDPYNAAGFATLAEALRGVRSDRDAAICDDRARSLTEGSEKVVTLVREAKTHPDDVEIRYQLGTLLAGLGRKQEAIRWLRGGLAINPNHKPCRDALAALEAP